MRECVCCPGNRNVPLLAALLHANLVIHRHADERAAAFFALGRALATQRPVAICCTSGSAVANLMPGLCEADALGAPLILLTADRPPRLQHCGAPQTMPQAGIFADFCRTSLHLPEPRSQGERLPEALQDVAAALTSDRAPGPVHINVPLDDPLPPIPDPDFHDPGPLPVSTPRPATSQAIPDWAHVLRPVPPSCAGIIVIGTGHGVADGALRQLADQSGYPLIADAGSGARAWNSRQVITTADRLCQDRLRDHRAQLLIRVGPAPLSRACYQWCANQDCVVIRIDRRPVVADFLHREFTTCPVSAIGTLVAQLPGLDPAWLQLWQQADQQARQAIDHAHTDGWSEQHAVAMALTRLPDRPLVVGNSLPIRHVNIIINKRKTLIHANRGLAGIDGTLATAAGRCRDEAPLVILGDVTCFHDLSSLHLLRSHCPRAVVLVLDNGGGRIFDQLPVAETPELLELLHCSCGVDLAAIATGFGWQAHCAASRETLQDALAQAIDGHHLIVARGF